MATLLRSERDHAVLAELNRPDVRNALDEELVDRLHELCADLEREPRVLMLTGAGAAFSAGADLRQLATRRAPQALRGINLSLFERIRRLPMPTISLVNGPAMGGGAELAYACDFRIGSPEARFGNPETGLGIAAAAGATWRLREIVGEPLAKEILLTGRRLSAEEALASGLLNAVTAADELLAEGDRWASRISEQAPLAVRLTKLLIDAPREAHPRLDEVTQAVLFESEEKAERIRGFLEGERA